MKVSNILFIVTLSFMLFDMNFKHKIIQWNCRGLKTKFEEICVLQQEENSSVFCLQETFLKKTVDNISLKGFNSSCS